MLRNKFKADLAEYEQAKAVYADKKKKAKADGVEFTEEPPERPTPHRVVVSDITVEKIAAVLEDNPRGTFLLRDELAAWFGSFTRYKGKAGGSDVPGWLEMHRAGPLIVDRKTGDRPSLFVPRASVCVAGGIQPGTLARCLTADHQDAGLGARILPAWPPRHPKVWKEDEIHPEVAQAYESLLRALAELTFSENDRKEREPFALRMTPEAKAVWKAFYNEWAKRQAAVEGATAAAFAKLEGGAARLALLHHVVSRVGAMADDCDLIEPDSMRAGITLAKWFAFESQRIYAALAETEDAGQTRRLIDFIRQHGGKMTARRLHKANRSRYPDADAADAALQTLVDGGIADWTAGLPGGRPTRVLVLKPDTPYPKSPESRDDEDEDDGEGGGGDTPKATPKAPSPCGNPHENEGSGAFGVWGNTTTSPNGTGGSGDGAPDRDHAGPGLSGYGPEESGQADRSDPQPGAATPEGVSGSGGDGFFVVTDAAGLELVRAALEETVVVGLDTETTSLDPRTGRVRLLSINCDTCTDGGRFTYVIDCFAVGSPARCGRRWQSGPSSSRTRPLTSAFWRPSVSPPASFTTRCCSRSCFTAHARPQAVSTGWPPSLNGRSAGPWTRRSRKATGPAR